MTLFLRTHLPLIMVILFWVFTTLFLGPLIYLVLPVTIFFFRSRDLWAEMIFGFLIILILSDMSPEFVPMRKIKSAKYAVMIALGIVFLMETNRFTPLSRVFNIFMPFFIYSVFPLVNGSDPINGLSKTISYALLYLIIPNYVLYNYRRQGWTFFRNLIFFILAVLLFSYLMRYLNPRTVIIGGRFRGLFGNPNGLGIFCFLSFMLVSVAIYLKKDLFNTREKLLVYGGILFFLIICGSRTSVVATTLFLVFSRFFSVSPFLGFMVFVSFLVVAELVSSNLSVIVIKLGLQKFFRVETLDDGSGRYFAWAFAWDQINRGGFFLFGGGFGNDEWVMRHNYTYLRSMGHHGGVHNSYLTMWFNTGITGVLLYFRSFFLLFVKANKKAPIAFGVLFATLFSVLYESWLTGSLNPFSILLVTIMTMMTEDEIVDWEAHLPDEEAVEGDDTQVVVPQWAARS
jgi:hypothetical protein